MFLETLNYPDGFKKLSLEQLQTLASEVRQRIIEVVSRTGGHLASSLGAVDLTLALHYCLNLPEDKLIFDVGHQTYAHKILTGRNNEFSNLRQYQGLSGFPSGQESVYDCFTTGHSSTAVSLALGLVCAAEINHTQKNCKVVAVIGDGSLSGGLCFEGLNNAGHLKKDLLVILNTNELSIAPNVGALSTYLNKIISLPIYNRFRGSLEQFIKTRVPKGSRLLKLADKFEEGLKGLFIPGILFEELGFRYFGPINGHNLEELIARLKNILPLPGPKILHVVTQKGKGYPPAEKDPVRFHSAAPFEIATGQPNVGRGIQTTYTEVFSQTLLKLAQDNPQIVAITAAMPEGTGLDKFRDAYPERFFDVGIAEAHAVCFAAGLAKANLRPLVAVYSTFLQRAYDQIIEAVALQGLPVVFALDRAGVVGEDGPTHQGVFDIVYLRHIPNVVVMAPADAEELKAMLELAFTLPQPVAMRYPKAVIPSRQLISRPLELGKADLLQEGKDVLLIALGSMVSPSLEACSALEEAGVACTLINARFARPLDNDLYRKYASQVKLIVTVEEGLVEGGFGSAVSEILDYPVKRLGLPAEFVTHGKRELLLAQYGLNASGITQRIMRWLK